MKTNLLKIAIPTATILFAIGASFTTHASQKSTTGISEAGYFTPIGFDSTGNAPRPCSIAANCTTYDSPLCMVMYEGQVFQAFGKINPGDVSCPMVLGRRDY